MKKLSKTFALSANLVIQGNFRFYIASMPSEILKATCFTITREDDPIKGFQRRLDESRAQEVADYIDTGVGSIPTAIILSAQEAAKLKYSSRNKTISVELHNHAFIIIDGQHRVWGFTKAKNSIRVPVVIYESLTRAEEARLFIDINQNQKSVPTELILDVKRLLDNESADEKRCSELFELFYTDKASILLSQLARAERSKGKLSRITFNNAVSGILKDNLNNLSADKSFGVINNYLKALQMVFSDINDNLKNAIIKPVIFQAVLESTIFSHIVDKANFKHEKLTVEAFQDIVQVFKNNLPVNKLLKPGQSYKRLSDNLLDALTKGVRLKATIITEE
jgi:DGQHR domain-containing protein